MPTDHFYTSLPLLEDFLDVANSEKFMAVPDDWYVLISDVVDSTVAIEAGRYREINLLGASSIVAILNIAKNLEIPFVFGGDGASILIPPSLLERSTQALLATQQLARKNFGLNLRIGIVPVAKITAEQYQIKVAKLRVSNNYTQALITGGGLTYATDLVKSSSVYQPEMKAFDLQADLSGLECRWQDIRSPRKQVLSLLILAVPKSEQERDQIYRNVIQTIINIYGEDKNFNPVIHQYLNLTFNAHKLSAEAKLKARSRFLIDRLLYLFKIGLENLLGHFLIGLKVEKGGVKWQQYKQDVVAASDYKKFDDILRMVISSHPAQTQKLARSLEQRSQAGELLFGLHISDRALMTCLVFERNGRQVHFIDGADGGYTIAGKTLKEKMRQKALGLQSCV